MNLSFEHPVYLWYLFSIPLLIITHFLSLRSAKRKAMEFANFKTLKRVAGKKYLTKNTIILIIRVLVITLLILSASGTTLWYTTERNDNNYVIAIDVSSSMASKDVKPTRLEAAKKYSELFIDTLNTKTEIGVLTFSGVTLIEQTMTDDKEDVKAAIKDITIVKAGGTDIPGAIITGTNMLLSTPTRGRVLIMLTDGSSTLGNFIDKSLQKAVDYAVKNHVVINAVGIGSETGPIGYLPEYYNISATYNERTLRLMTNSTGGTLLEAKNEEEMKQAFAALTDAAEEAYVKVRLDLGLLVTALLLLFIEWGLINSRYRRIT